MAIAKKGSRIICVDGVKYRWLIQRKPSDSQYCYPQLHSGLDVAIECIDWPETTLVLWTDRQHPLHLISEKPIVPADIANWIRQSLELGWKPELKGGTLIFNIVENQVVEVTD
jgi:hypothetical protein